MTKRTEKRFKEYVQSLAESLRIQLFLNEYEIRIAFHGDEYHPDDNEDSRTSCTIGMDSVYLFAQLRVYKPFFDQWAEGNVGACFSDMLHEFCHLLIEPVVHLARKELPPQLQSAFNDTIERQTQRLARVIEFWDKSKIEYHIS